MVDKKAESGSADQKVWQRILGKLENVSEDVMSLDITTKLTGNQNKVEIKTTIDLIQGDIKNEINEAFITDEKLHPIRDFHAQQVEKGHSIVKNNIETIVALVKTLRDIE